MENVETLENVSRSATRDNPRSFPRDIRKLIPEKGLPEYWYPAISARQVGRKKPLYLKLLGEELALFRGKDGAVRAVGNVCPHRGGFLSAGDCHFPGTISCPYHGATFDETGECVAVLGEGPTSRIPGTAEARARVYPTRTLKGLVFVWMGEGEPAPIEEDVPEDFFDDGDYVLHWTTVWNSNWRPAVENVFDAHGFYIHNAALWFYLQPAELVLGFLQGGPTRPRPHNINGRAIAYRAEEMAAGIPQGTVAKDPATMSLKELYQDSYPGLNGAKWPKNGSRIYWHWLVGLFPRRQHEPMVVRNEEWCANSVHLPSIVRLPFPTPKHMFTRTVVPIDGEKSRIFYYNTVRGASRWKKIYEFVKFHVWQIPLLYRNFSSQDAEATTKQYYNTPEKLWGSDRFPLEWRRCVINNARGVSRVPEYEITSK